MTAPRELAEAVARLTEKFVTGIGGDLPRPSIMVDVRLVLAALAAPPSTAAMSETDLLLKIRASTAATTLREMLLRAALDGCGAIGYGSDEANMDVATDIVDRILGSTAATPEGK